MGSGRKAALVYEAKRAGGRLIIKCPHCRITNNGVEIDRAVLAKVNKTRTQVDLFCVCGQFLGQAMIDQAAPRPYRPGEPARI